MTKILTFTIQFNSRQILKPVVFILFFISNTWLFAGERDIQVISEKNTLIAPTGQTYKWYYNNKQIGSSQSLKVTQSGLYTVETISRDGKVTRLQTVIQSNGTSIRTVHIIGDSTVMTYSASWYPWGGWGAFLPYFFDTTLDISKPSLQFQNHAVGGRSSKSFYDEGKWAQVLAVLLPGDVYMIQFGHNDRDFTNAARYADTATYKSYLKKYIDEGRLKGANPILVTPMNMNTWFCDVMRNVFREGKNNYRGAMINLGREMNVPVIDLEDKSDALFEKVGRDYTTHFLFNNLQPGEYPNYPNGYSDYTHFQEMGAIEMSKLVLEGLKEKPSDPAIATLLPFLVPEYKVTITSKNPTGGVVTRSNTFPKGLTITLKGIAHPTHQFDSWTDETGSTVTNNKMFSFVMDTIDRSFAVNFKDAADLQLQAGTYRLYNAGSVNKTQQLMEVYNNSTSNGASIVQNPGNGKTNQQWKVKHLGDGYYTFIAVNSGKSMDVSGSSLADGGKVIQYTPNPSANNQQFKLVKINGNIYNMIAKHSGKYLQFASGTCGANLVQAAYDPGNENQKFVLQLLSLDQPVIARASNPSPADTAPVVSPDSISLKWTGDAQSYNVFMGTSAASLMLKASGITESSLQLDSITALGKYFWRVDALRDGQTEVGDTWSFTVKDTVAPIAISKNVSISLDSAGLATVSAAMVDNGSNDRYGIASMTLDKASFNCSNVGDNPVILKVTDTNGNTAEASAIITVKDDIAPVVSVKNFSVNLSNGHASVDPSDIDNGSSDACGIKTMSLSRSTFDCSSIGDHTITLTATDTNGNSSSANAIVTVVGSIPDLSIEVSRQDNTFTGTNANTIILGYGAQNVTLSAVDKASEGPHQYIWTPAANLSSTDSANPVFTPTAAGDYTFTVTTINEYGCSASDTIMMKVTDARCGDMNDKVLVCHYGNVVCISSSDVKPHLDHGCSIGLCNGATISSVGMEDRSELKINAETNPIGSADGTNYLQTYPNPTSASLTIKFYANKDSKYSLNLYNVLGGLIKAMDMGFSKDGMNYSKQFDLSTLSSGIYILKLITNDEVFSKRIIIQH